jgi:hypothetical protein
VKRLVPFLIIVCSACLERTDAFEASSAANSTLTTSGSLACAPSATEAAGCAGKAVGDGCTDVLTNGRIAFFGICHATLDGTSLACAPGHTPREHAPPPFEITACTNLDAGDGCTLPEHFGRFMQANADAGVIDGTCVAAAGDAGTVACRPFTHEERACAGLAAGAGCALGPTCGTCEAPASGGAALCVVSCNSPFFGDDFGGYDGHHGAFFDGGCPAADAGTGTADAGTADAGN